MPTSVTDFSLACNRHQRWQQRKAPPAHAVAVPAPGQICRVDTALTRTLVLLLISNTVLAAQARPVPPQPTSTAPPPVPPCAAAPRLTLPIVLHDMAQLARSPVTFLYGTGRTLYYRDVRHRCPPPESPAEEVLTELGDLGAGLLEARLLGPDGVVAVREGSFALDGLADVLEDGTVHADTVQGLVQEQSGFKAMPRAGDARGDEDVGGDADAPASRGVRCRRAPGDPCRLPVLTLSDAVETALQPHLELGLTPAQARERGILPDPERPGWHVRVRDGQRKPFLRVHGRYFPVKRHAHGGGERWSVHAPRIARIDQVRLRHPLGGQRLLDIAPSPASDGPGLLTQAEYNVRFRGFSSLEAAQVYEQAVRNAPTVHLSQAEHRALLRYATHEQPALDDFMRFGTALLGQREALSIQLQDLRQALARIPPHAGPVYRSATLPPRVLQGLTVGSTVFCRSFMRASGDRRVAERHLQAVGNPIDGVPVLVRLDMRSAAHPVGLYTLQDEAEVLIDSARVFTVTAVGNGELVLEEVGAARQALGLLGALPLDLV